MHMEIPELDRKGLREFGLVTGGIVAVLFGLVLPWLFNFNYPQWPWWVGGVLIAWALLLPDTLNPVYKVWMRIGQAIGWVMSKLILGIMFFFIITPVGLVMRLVGYRPMHDKLEADAETYRKTVQASPPEQMEKPY